MANYSTLRHSKTLVKTRIPIFSALASTLGYLRSKIPRPLPRVGSSLDRGRGPVQINPFPILGCGRVLKHPRNTLSPAESDAYDVYP
jgi:hypothetical protein